MENTSYKTFSHAKRNFEVESDPFLMIFTYSSTVDEHKIIIHFVYQGENKLKQPKICPTPLRI